mmetsp:Transcript_130977/g.184575  ORF Transcript_130977/g.184575 Transcript_130977/m.184575 type:complete len:258 (-) Transcript_130977:258-1031(-)
MPRSLAQRRTRRISSPALGCNWELASKSSAARPGVVAFTAKLKGMLPSSAGAMSVTLGSAPRKAERLNLKDAWETRRSVQVRIIDFCSFPPSPEVAFASSVTTTSTSGTATPKAVPETGFAVAKASTAAPGSAEPRARRTALAMAWTCARLASFGCSVVRSSTTSASNPLAAKRGAWTGITLGRRTSGFTAGGCAVGVALERSWLHFSSSAAVKPRRGSRRSGRGVGGGVATERSFFTARGFAGCRWTAGSSICSNM